jgi:hypothetical protein
LYGGMDASSKNAYLLVYEREHKSKIKLFKQQPSDEETLTKVMGFNPFSKSSLINDDTIESKEDKTKDKENEEEDNEEKEEEEKEQQEQEVLKEEEEKYAEVDFYEFKKYIPKHLQKEVW